MQLIIKDKVASVDEVVAARLGLTVVEVDGYEEGATSDEKVSLILYLFIFLHVHFVCSISSQLQF